MRAKWLDGLHLRVLCVQCKRYATKREYLCPRGHCASCGCGRECLTSTQQVA